MTSNFFTACDKFAAYLGEPPMPRLEYITTPVYGLSKATIEQLEADRRRFELEEVSRERV